MKSLYTVCLFVLLASAAQVNAQYDDLYDDPLDIYEPMVFVEEDNPVDINTVEVTTDEYEQYIDQPYQFASRIKRFDESSKVSNYYSPYFVDAYYYNTDPFGNTIYTDYSDDWVSGVYDNDLSQNSVFVQTPQSASVFGSTSTVYTSNGQVYVPNRTTSTSTYGTGSSARRTGSTYNNCPIGSGGLSRPNTTVARPTNNNRTSTSSTSKSRTKTSGSVLSGNGGGSSTPVYRAPQSSGSSGSGSSTVPNRRETPTRTTPSRSSRGSVRY